MAAQYNPALSPELLQKTPEICPHKLKRGVSNQAEEEEEVKESHSMVASLLDVSCDF
jgi:hypothetical protein